LLLRLEAVRRSAPPELAEQLAEVRGVANRAMEELLALARQLRPTALDDLGLEAALASHARDIGRQSGVSTSFDRLGTFIGLPGDVQTVVYRVAQEALSNAVRHANASHIGIHLARGDAGIALVVADDGSGFTFAQASGGLGITGMRERALLVGGDLEVTSRPGQGTRVRLYVPIEIDDADRNGS
jgi:two-component system sensor histidine kinase UhpB